MSFGKARGVWDWALIVKADSVCGLPNDVPHRSLGMVVDEDRYVFYFGQWWPYRFVHEEFSEHERITDFGDRDQVVRSNLACWQPLKTWEKEALEEMIR